VKASWQTITSGLDQLYSLPLIKDESASDRSQAIETFILTNGWTWDEVIDMIAKESIDGQSPIRD
jgi:hypothetical protein